MFTLLHYRGAGKFCFDTTEEEGKKQHASKKYARTANYRHRHRAVKTVKIYDHINVVSNRIAFARAREIFAVSVQLSSAQLAK